MANENNNQSNRKSGRGFAGMDRDKQREIASAGGKAAHQGGNAHEWTSDEAREAGRRGGQARSQNQSRNLAASGDDLIR
jgi:general stress protein YciG